MCRYCEKEYPLIKKDFNFGLLGVSEFAVGLNTTQSKSVKFLGLYAGDNHYLVDYIGINYCPMCGRNLKENKDDTNNN